jgi:hypothetical protein
MLVTGRSREYRDPHVLLPAAAPGPCRLRLLDDVVFQGIDHRDQIRLLGILDPDLVEGIGERLLRLVP